MAKKKNRRSGDESESGTRPKAKSGSGTLNSPFEELARELKKQRAREARAERKARAEGPPAAADNTTSPSGAGKAEEVRPPSDEEEFARAMAGARPVTAQKPRIFIPPPVKMVSTETIEDEDLLALEAARGFELSYADRFVRGRAQDVSLDTLMQLEAGVFAIRRHADLHGYTLEEARRVADDFLQDSQQRGDYCVLLVTGKGKNSPRGKGVLCEQVPDWLARGPSARRVLAFCSARDCDGGEGALYVLLRRKTGRKGRFTVERGGPGPMTGR